MPANRGRDGLAEKEPIQMGSYDGELTADQIAWLHEQAEALRRSWRAAGLRGLHPSGEIEPDREAGLDGSPPNPPKPE